MASGYQVFDEQGRVVLDTTTRTGRILGSVSISGQNGSITVPTVSGTPFVVIPKWPAASTTGQFGSVNIGGTVTFDGTSIKWNFGFGGTVSESTTVYYGAY